MNLALQIANAEKSWNHKNQDCIYLFSGCLRCYVTETYRRQRGHGKVRNLDQRNTTGRVHGILSSCRILAPVLLSRCLCVHLAPPIILMRLIFNGDEPHDTCEVSHHQTDHQIFAKLDHDLNLNSAIHHIMIDFYVILLALIGDEGCQILHEIASNNWIDLFGIQDVDKAAQSKDFEEPEESQEMKALVDVS